MMKKIPYCIYQGKRVYEGDGLYIQVSKRFFRGGLRGISRALKANCHDAAVCVLEDTAGDEKGVH